MESIFKFIIFLLLLLLIYHWCLYYYKNNHYTKKIYKSISTSNIEKFSVGGTKTDKESYCTENPDVCKNGGKCIDDDEYDYTCECKTISGVDSSGKRFSGRSFSGKNCDVQDDMAEGARVELLKNIGEIIPLMEYKRVALFKMGNNQWNDYL